MVGEPVQGGSAKQGSSMLLLEHHGKDLLRQYGFATPVGMVVDSLEGLSAALESMPGRVVLKAQIPIGRRGKIGGIQFADSPEDARRVFRMLRGRIVAGHAVYQVLVEERVNYRRERYAGIEVTSTGLRLLFAKRGGIEIEAITQADQSNWQSIAIDPLSGPDPAVLRDSFRRLGYEPEFYTAYEEVAHRLFRMCIACDATLIEINPLVECDDGHLCALDARIVLDADALSRQPALAALVSSQQADSAESRSRSWPTIRRTSEGAVALIGLGSGLNMAIMDWVADYGAAVGALVDMDEAFAAGRTEQGFVQTFGALDQDGTIRAILVNIITCGYRLDDIVPPLLRALDRRAPPAKPTCLHLRGNAMTETPALLASAGWANSASLKQAIEHVAAITKG
jgi:succinyl-CoA synthetase beta subunit